MAKYSLKNLIRSLVEDEPEETEGSPAEAVNQTESQPSAEQEPVEAPLPPDIGRLPELKGSMKQVWEKWQGEGELTPILSMTAGLPREKLLLDKQQLDREGVRITVQLEQDAKRRMRLITEAEERGMPDMDAQCRVYVSRDKMLAWVFVFPPVAEGAFHADAIGGALQAAGVTTGIDSERLMRIFEEKQFFQLIPIAVGTPVEEGEDGSILEFFPREIPVEVKIDECGLADYKHSNYVRQIHQGDVICDIIPPVEGQAGLRVDGTVITPKTVHKAKVPKGANTVITEDGLQLVSGIDGHLEYSNSLFQVRQVLVVEGDVDYNIGNIEFTGNVHVKGDVRENFHIIATGSVSVDGLVEAATIEAGGDLVITRGVVGDNRALLRSGGCVRVKYLENCVVYAGKGVFADCVMNSQIFSDTFIAITTGRGSVIGGTLTAAQSIKAKMIGAQSGRRTELVMGVLPYVQHELQDIEEDLASNRREQQELKKVLQYLEREQGLAGSDARLAKSRMRRSVLEMKEQQLLKRQERLRPITPDITKCVLESGVIYPVTRLTVQELVWTAKEVRKHCKVRFDSETGELKEFY